MHTRRTRDVNVCLQVELRGAFVPFESAAVQASLEQAWQAGKRAVVVRLRGMDKEVTLVTPMLQRGVAGGEHAHARERRVRRRVLDCIELDE